MATQFLDIDNNIVEVMVVSTINGKTNITIQDTHTKQLKRLPIADFLETYEEITKD